MPEVLPQLVDQKPNGCWTACIASLTGLPYEEFPDPPADEDHGCDYHNAVVHFLHARGWALLHAGTRIPRGYAVAGGKSPRGLQHAVVMKDGQMVHDPHPSRAGLLKIEDYEIVIPILGLLPTGIHAGLEAVTL